MVAKCVDKFRVPPGRRRLWLAWVPALFGCALSPAIAEPAAAAAFSADSVVSLPPVIVSDTRLLPRPESWRYARVGGFEILSTASDGTTRQLVDDFLLFHRAVETIWPIMRMNSAQPASLILCARPSQFAEFAPANAQREIERTLSLSLQDREQASIVINLEPAESGGMDADGTDADSGGISSYSDALLRQEYVHFLLSRIGPQTPAWLMRSLSAILTSLQCQGDLVGVPALPEDETLAARRAFAAHHPSDALAAAHLPAAPSPDRRLRFEDLEKDRGYQAARRHGTFAPLSLLLGSAAGAGETAVASATDDPREKERIEWVRLCLFGENQRFRRPFIEFCFLSARLPPDGALFKRCFGLDYDQMTVALWAYAGYASGLTFEFNPKAARATPRPVLSGLRPASDADVGRIKGDALRMGGRLADAHLALVAPYLRGSRDPELLAALGMEEKAAGRNDRARRFLQAAASGGTRHARAYLDLAQLRYSSALAAPAGRARQLDTAQLAGVLKLLFSARALPPSLPEVYELMAEAWLHADVRPRPGHLAAIDEGVELFPDDGDLLYSAATLHARNGSPALAAQLCKLGLQSAATPSSRDRFLTLKASLPAAAAP